MCEILLSGISSTDNFKQTTQNSDHHHDTCSYIKYKRNNALGGGDDEN